MLEYHIDDRANKVIDNWQTTERMLQSNKNGPINGRQIYNRFKVI